MMIIYKIENKINGKIYIGQTKQNLNKRIGDHLAIKSFIGNVIRKYGLQCFDISVIDVAYTKEILDQKEKEYIALYNCKAPNGYNLTDGGDGRNGSGTKHSEEWNRKISQSLMGHVGAKAWKGKNLPKEMREKISRSKRGKPSPKRGKIYNKKDHQTGHLFNYIEGKR